MKRADHSLREKKEHIRNAKTAARGSRIANHAWSHDHVIDFNNASIIDKAVLASESFWNLGTP